MSCKDQIRASMHQDIVTVICYTTLLSILHNWFQTKSTNVLNLLPLVSNWPQLICLQEKKKKNLSCDPLKDAISHVKLQINEQNYRKLAAKIFNH
jgi:hypothetical protein